MLQMESSVVFCAVLLWTTVFTAVSVEGISSWQQSTFRTDPHTQLGSMVTAQNTAWFKKYHPLKEIRQFFIDLATKYPEFVKMEKQIGSKKGMFAVGITIPPISVSVKSGQSNLLGSRDNDKPKRDEVEEKMSSIVHQKPLFTPKKRKIYIQCLIHGRDWISGTVCPFFAEYLVTHMKEPKVKTLLESIEFVMVPVVNPDGYKRTWLVESTWIEPVGNWAKGKLWYGGKHRFWNKNMSPSGDPKCVGVDLDRNFPTPRWTEGPHIQVTTNKGSNKGSGHSSKAKIVDKCSDNYSGPKAGSEPEVQTIIKLIERIAPVVGAIDFQAYSQFVHFPNGWTRQPPKDFDHLSRVACLTAHAMSKKHQYVYRAMNGETSSSTATGSFYDWAYTLGPKYNKGYRIIPITVQLRPTSHSWSWGFLDAYHSFSSQESSNLRYLLPQNEIIATCEEAVDGILEFAHQVLKYPLKH